MTRLAYLGSLCLVALACATLPACGQQDNSQAVIAQCSNPPPTAVDSCLEQVRVLNETNPTKDTQTLEAQLIQMQVRAHEQPPTDQPDPNAPPANDQGVSSYDTTPPPPPASDMMPDDNNDPPPPADEAPPAEQGNPADAGPPPDMPTTPYPGQQQTPPPSSGGPGRGN